MTPFRLILDSSGLSIQEAAAYLDVRLDTVLSWSSGRRTPRRRIVHEVLALIDRQGQAAREILTVIERSVAGHDAPAEIEIGFAADDHEARALGWPAASAHAAVIRRLIEIAPPDVRGRLRLVPRGATPATAAAADSHQA